MQFAHVVKRRVRTDGGLGTVRAGAFVGGIEHKFWTYPDVVRAVADAEYIEDQEQDDIDRHALHAFLETRETYCESGINGLFASRFVVLCALFSAVGGLLFGYDQGVIAVILVEPQFLQRFPQVADGAVESGFAKGLLTAMIELGALFGALNQGWIADKYSRKYSIGIAAVVFIVGSGLQTSANGYAMLVIARLVGGVGIGMLSMVAPLYISEISPPEIRGTLLVLEELSIVVGAVIAFWLTYGMQYVDSEWAWRFPFLVQIVPALFLGFGVFVLPFSPRWLVSEGRDEEALCVLAKLRELPIKDRRVLREWIDIRAEAVMHRELSAVRHPSLQKDTMVHRMQLELSTWLDLFKPNCRRRIHIGVGLMFFQQFIGVNALLYYLPTMLKYLGFDYNTTLIMSGIINIAQLVGCATSIWSMDRVGRRGLLLAGSVVTFLCHSSIAILFSRSSHDWPGHQTEGWVCVGLLLLYMVSFGGTWGPVPWAMPSEIFPPSLRGRGVALSTASNWLNNAIIGVITPPLVQETGYGAYVFFAVFCLLSGVWTFCFVPETSGKSLEEMDSVFQDASAKGETIRRERIARDLAAKIFET